MFVFENNLLSTWTYTYNCSILCATNSSVITLKKYFSCKNAAKFLLVTLNLLITSTKSKDLDCLFMSESGDFPQSIKLPKLRKCVENLFFLKLK